MPENVNPQVEETATNAPTKEEVIAFFQEQIDVKKVQLDLQELNTKLAIARSEELKALSFIAQMTNPQAQGGEYEGGTPHTITDEDLELNPELKEQGLKAGDEVLIPSQEKPKDKRSLKKK
jgi:hypothetical protein